MVLQRLTSRHTVGPWGDDHMPAFTKPPRGPNDLASSFRRELGRWLKQLREQQGLTQANVAKAIGVDFPTTVSAMELGRIAPPPARYADLATVYGLAPDKFYREILRLTNPWGHAMLFDKDPAKAISDLNERFLGKAIND